MGIITGALKSAAKKAFIVALVYGGKKAASKIAGKIVKSAADKKKASSNR
jgi:hypothetical protein